MAQKKHCVGNTPLALLGARMERVISINNPKPWIARSNFNQSWYKYCLQPEKKKHSGGKIPLEPSGNGTISTKLGAHITYGPEKNTVGIRYP